MGAEALRHPLEEHDGFRTVNLTSSAPSLGSNDTDDDLIVERRSKKPRLHKELTLLGNVKLRRCRYPGNQVGLRSFLKLAESQEFARESHFQRLKKTWSE